MRITQRTMFFSFILTLIILCSPTLCASKDLKKITSYDAAKIIQDIKQSDKDAYETEDKKLVIIGPLVKELKANNEEVIRKFKAEIATVNKLNNEAPELPSAWTMEYFPNEKDQPVVASLSDGQ